MTVENNQNQTVNTDTSKSEETSNKPVPADSSNKLDIRNQSALSLRPIKSSELKVVETINVMGIRPIAAHSMEVVNTITASGIRPIAASNLAISKQYSLLGNRPVMIKVVDESDSLMGYLD
ncbi:MAG: hypothetical protein QNJ51_15240 [Calothrix sp. MO_167.B12]|nr:hypothetical protein [Calothrix sp. MO_167.B12]